VRSRQALRPHAGPLLRVLPAIAAGAAAGVVPGPPDAVSAALAGGVFVGVAVATGAVPADVAAALRRRSA
jgi:hypothetical protein